MASLSQLSNRTTPLHMTSTPDDKKTSAFPAGSINGKQICIGCSVAVVVVAVVGLAVILAIGSNAMGPLLWALGPNATAVLVGKIFTYMSIAGWATGIPALMTLSCSFSSFVAAKGND